LFNLLHGKFVVTRIVIWASGKYYWPTWIKSKVGRGCWLSRHEEILHTFRDKSRRLRSGRNLSEHGTIILKTYLRILSWQLRTTL